MKLNIFGNTTCFSPVFSLRVLDIILVHILTIAKQVMQWHQTLHTPLGSHSTTALSLMYGHTLVSMHHRSSSGSRVSSPHRIIMETLFVHPIHLRGQELELVLLHRTNQRSANFTVWYKTFLLGK